MSNTLLNGLVSQAFIDVWQVICGVVSFVAQHRSINSLRICAGPEVSSDQFAIQNELRKLMEKPHKKLIAWQRCMELVVLIYELTRSFPREELYGLIGQMRRAAVSAPSNIAEGAADRSAEQFRNFLAISVGSLNELDTQLEIANRVGYLSNEDLGKAQKLLNESVGLTYGLKKSIERRINGGKSVGR